MLPLLSGEHLPFERVEELFEQADKDHSGVLELEEFVWLLGALAAQAEKAHAGKAGGGGRERSLKSVEELKADRLREEQQAALQQRASTLRLKVDSP